MGCCGSGGRPLRVKRQIVEPQVDAPEIVSQTVHKKISKQAAQPVGIQRQYILPKLQCPKCGYPAMLVHIAGRERQQCSNANCRVILQ